MSKKRGSFSGGLGFVFAAAGSAVGLGNLWRFPYYAAKYGGGTFIFIYIILALTFGFSLLTAEIAIGRKTKLSPILAYKKLCSKFSFLGYLATLVPTIIIPYYCVIGGWVTKYMCVYAQGLVAPAAQDNFFSDFISDPLSPIVFFLIFMLLSAVVIMLGVNKGIERLSKFLMPVLLVLTVGILHTHAPKRNGGCFVLPHSRFQQTVNLDICGGTRSAVLLNEHCNGNYGNLWFIHKE